MIARVSSGKRTRPSMHFSAPRRKENEMNSFQAASRGREAKHMRRVRSPET